MTTRAGYIDARPRIIARAIAEVGVAEATGRNDGARVEQYIALGTASAREPGLSWCAAFVLWCHRQEGVNLPGNPWALRRVSTLYEEARRAGAILAHDEVPAVGDLAIYLGRASSHAGPSGHVQLVVGVATSMDDALTARLDVVGGNEGNAVRRSWVLESAPTAFARPERWLR